MVKRLNIGCGTVVLEGWDNYDLNPCDERVSKLDVRELPLPFENEYADIILLDNVMEHVNYRLALLKELQRVLKEGGKLVVRLPIVGIGSGHESYFHTRDYFRSLTKDNNRSTQFTVRRPLFASVSVRRFHFGKWCIRRLLYFLAALFESCLWRDYEYVLTKEGRRCVFCGDILPTNYVNSHADCMREYLKRWYR